MQHGRGCWGGDGLQGLTCLTVGDVHGHEELLEVQVVVTVRVEHPHDVAHEDLRVPRWIQLPHHVSADIYR